MINIEYEDKNLVVINKPSGIIVHAGAGETGLTLVDFILDKYPEMKKHRWPDPMRPGIVHRLDKDTSGLIVAAKDPETQKILQDQFKNRTVDKRYLVLVLGKVEPETGKIVAQIGRDQKNRLQQKVAPMVFSWTRGKTRAAETRYKVLRYYAIPLRQGFAGQKTYLSFLEVKPITGRMHQIRVHLKYHGYPIIGDQIYNTKESKEISKKLGATRQFLHSYKIKIKLPDGSEKELESQLPEDLQSILKKLK